MMTITITYKIDKWNLSMISLVASDLPDLQLLQVVVLISTRYI